MLHFTKVRLKGGVTGSTGALVSYLAANARDIGAAHQLVWSLFPDLRPEEGDTAPRDRVFLFHMTGKSLREDVLIYSTMPPHDPHGLWEMETRPFAPDLQPGDSVQFFLRANPTVSRDGKRHDLVQHSRLQLAADHPLRRDREALAQSVVPAWTEKGLAKVGLSPVTDTVVVTNYTQHDFTRKGGRGSARIATVDIRGVATVSDPDRLLAGLIEGIGHGRAFGCGMLLVKKVALRQAA